MNPKGRLSQLLHCTGICAGILWSTAAFPALGTWQKSTNKSPIGNPGNVALLTDGRVLFQGSETSAGYVVLSPSGDGTYVNGTFSTIANGMPGAPANSTVGRVFNPSFVLRDGRYFSCGGEYQYPGPSNPATPDFGECELFDPTTGIWTVTPRVTGDVFKDGVGAELGDGTVLMLSYTNSDSWIFKSFNQTPSWTTAKAYSRGLLDNEGGSLLLQDGSVLVGKQGFARYMPSSNTWAPTNAPPGGNNAYVLLGGPGGFSPEIGPMLLLHGGKALLLGSNSANGLYNPATNSWTNAAATPTVFGVSVGHGDTSAVVEVKDKVMTILSGDLNGAGGDSAVFMGEYDPLSDDWQILATPVPTVGATVSCNRTRFLALPDGTVLYIGSNDGYFYIYYPEDYQHPLSFNAPTITSITGPTSGVYTIHGTQLNGLTTGADFGDDGKFATNYPIVALKSGSSVTYCPTYNVDQMAPRAQTAGTVSFTVPPTLNPGTYSVAVSASGIQSTQSFAITTSGVHPEVVFGTFSSAPNLTPSWTVLLSAAAPSGGTVVNLSSSNTAVATVPATITIPAGQSTGSFALTAKALGYASISMSTSGTSYVPLKQTIHVDQFVDTCPSATADVTLSGNTPSTSPSATYGSGLCPQSYVGVANSGSKSVGGNTVVAYPTAYATYAGPITTPSFLGCNAMWVTFTVWRKYGDSYTRVADSPLVAGTQVGNNCVAPTASLSLSSDPNVTYEITALSGAIFTIEPVTIGVK
ncbi:MAG: hypothetical protein ACRENE_26290 [Polyangiaceae bacterium]